MLNIDYMLMIQFLISVKSVQETGRKAELVMKDITSWMANKNLKLNEDKTDCMLFETKTH